MKAKKTVKKTKKRPTLPPISIGEVVEFPCGATVTINHAGWLSSILLIYHIYWPVNMV